MVSRTMIILSFNYYEYYNILLHYNVIKSLIKNSTDFFRERLRYVTSTEIKLNLS